MRKEWVVKILGKDEIYFYNSIGGKSGPWSWDQDEWTVTDLTERYGPRRVSDRLAEDINLAIREGWGTVRYSSEDLSDAQERS